MTQEEKELLLLKDLCTRLPYRTMVKCITDYHREFDEELSVRHIMNFYQFEVKPYLRPMSSMTEEERNEFENLFPRYSISEKRGSVYHSFRGDLNLDIIDWLNAHHFDYRGLIEKGLALESPEGMYNN